LLFSEEKLHNEYIETHLIRSIDERHYSTWNELRIVLDGDEFISEDKQLKAKINSAYFTMHGTTIIRILEIDRPLLSPNLLSSGISFRRIISKTKPGDQILDKIAERIRIFNDCAAELDIGAIQEDMQLLLRDCSMLVEKFSQEAEIKMVLEKYGVTWDDLYVLIERHVISRTYDMVFFKICKEYREEDLKCLRILGKSKYALLQGCYGVNLLKPRQEFPKIELGRSPQEKINVIVNTIEWISNGSIVPLSADAILPTFITCILQTEIFNLFSILKFIQLFSFEKSLTAGKIGQYCLI
jgi:hypothetical protein